MIDGKNRNKILIAEKLIKISKVRVIKTNHKIILKGNLLAKTTRPCTKLALMEKLSDLIESSKSVSYQLMAAKTTLTVIIHIGKNKLSGHRKTY